MNKPNNLEPLWMPFTPNKVFKKDPRIIVGAKDMHFISDDNREILDGTAGLWCVNAGHGRKKIQEAVNKQIENLDYSPPFQFGHPKQFELANRLAEIFPEGMNHVFFSNSGSEAVDSALKIALAYQRARGHSSKTRLIGRERGYHGVGFGGISVGGMVKNRMYFGSMLNGVDHLRHTHNLKLNAFSKGEPEHGAELADDLERLVQLHDASTIAAVIVEPIAGSTGALPPPKGYLKRLRELCTKHDILLIFDEVVTAFGRMGKATGSEFFGVTPDIISCATLSQQSLVFGKWLRAGQHLDMVGAYRPDMREMDDECLLRSRVFVDNFDGACRETGDIAIPLSKGIISKKDIEADLFSLCKQEIIVTRQANDITVFKSVGHALEDLVAAKLVGQYVSTVKIS